MTSTPNPSSIDLLLTSLKTELENKNEGAFERLSAHLLSPFLGDIAITVAKSGHQVGADGGTAGARGRRLRIECKRYKEATGLSSRHLAGELAEAVEADDCWKPGFLWRPKLPRKANATWLSNWASVPSFWLRCPSTLARNGCHLKLSSLSTRASVPDTVMQRPTFTYEVDLAEIVWNN